MNWPAIGQLDPDESMRLQHNLAGIWEDLYFGTLRAVRDQNTDDCTWDEADNTYSDGRTVMIQIRIEPWETSESNWAHNPFTLGDGAVADHPRGTIAYIAPSIPTTVGGRVGHELCPLLGVGDFRPKALLGAEDDTNAAVRVNRMGVVRGSKGTVDHFDRQLISFRLPFGPVTLYDSGALARRVTAASRETVCPTCHLIHAGECG